MQIVLNEQFFFGLAIGMSVVTLLSAIVRCWEKEREDSFSKREMTRRFDNKPGPPSIPFTNTSKRARRNTVFTESSLSKNVFDQAVGFSQHFFWDLFNLVRSGKSFRVEMQYNAEAQSVKVVSFVDNQWHSPSDVNTSLIQDGEAIQKHAEPFEKDVLDDQQANLVRDK